MVSRSAVETVLNRQGDPVLRECTRTLTARQVMLSSRRVWLECSFLDVALMELERYAKGRHKAVRFLMCDRFTSLLRTPQNKYVSFAEAHEAARRCVSIVGQCTAMATLINIGESHWCAAYVSLTERKVLVYDPLGPATLSHETEFAVNRLKILAEKVLAAQMWRVPTTDGSSEWETTPVLTPVQGDHVSCGVFCLQYLAGIVSGELEPTVIQAPHADVLRLVVIHKLLTM